MEKDIGQMKTKGVEMPEAVIKGQRQHEEGSVEYSSAKKERKGIFAYLQGTGNQMDIIPQETAPQSWNIDDYRGQGDQRTEHDMRLIQRFHLSKQVQKAPPISLSQDAVERKEAGGRNALLLL